MIKKILLMSSLIFINSVSCMEHRGFVGNEINKLIYELKNSIQNEALYSLLTDDCSGEGVGKRIQLYKHKILDLQRHKYRLKFLIGMMENNFMHWSVVQKDIRRGKTIRLLNKVKIALIKMRRDLIKAAQEVNKNVKDSKIKKERTDRLAEIYKYYCRKLDALSMEYMNTPMIKDVEEGV